MSNERLLRADVDFDGQVSVADSESIQQEAADYLAGHGTYTPQQVLVADINRNGVVDFSDAQLVMQYYLDRLAGKFTTWEYLLYLTQV